jgi:AcrR family transcriptional regulator
VTDARAYRSPRRERQAEDTRTQILTAARRLFSERGYAASPIAEIAAAAGVSVPTVYSSVGSKAQVALSLVQFINAEVDMGSLVAAQAQAPTGREVLAANARLARVLNEQCGDIIRALLSAAASDPEVAPAAAEGRRVHREGCARVAARLHAMGELTERLDMARAGAVLATYTAPEAIERLTVEHQWSFDEVEAWLTDAMSLLLLRRR